MGEVNSIKCVPKMYIEGKKGTWRLSWRTPKGTTVEEKQSSVPPPTNPPPKKNTEKNKQEETLK